MQTISNEEHFFLKVSVLDDGVGNVVNALNEKQMLDNTVILFFCDNGAPTNGGLNSNGGSNNPFRGVNKTKTCLPFK